MKDRNVTVVPAYPRPSSMREAERSRQKVAAYARVSTDRADQESSLEAQTDYYQKMIAKHPGWQFAGIFVDDGISGLSTDARDGFREMIETALSGGIDLVLTKSISRFARNTVDTITVIRLLREKDIGVFFEKENLFTLDSKSEFLLAVMSSLAQEESRSISENVRWGIRKKFADGKGSVGYSHFLGYDKGPQKHTMVVNEDQAKTVKRMYFLFLQGYGIGAIKVILDREEAETPSGGRTWCSSTILSILTNERYKGDALLQILNPNPIELTPFNDYTGQSLKRVKSTITKMPVLGGISADFIVDSATYHGSHRSRLNSAWALFDNVCVYDLPDVHRMCVAVRHRIGTVNVLRIHIFPDILRKL